MSEKDLIERVRLVVHPIGERATQEEVNVAESRLGFALPPLLRGLYENVANGGWGPAYGFQGLVNGHQTEGAGGVVHWYERFRQPDQDDPNWGWPRTLLPACYWGCAIWSCVDCSSPDGRVVAFDPNGHDPDDPWDWSFVQERLSLEAWITDWLAGRVQQPAAATPPD